ncbi:hypothetical protein ABIB75_006995 [Bradyrhizobium sp. GM2.2]|uniref:hypothetical protein n=1 Tax=Bradyrhizobium sp. GM2.2 TaxID=3156358 RepID=UPI003399AB58
MEAILIDPNTKSVARIDISTDGRPSDYFCVPKSPVTVRAIAIDPEQGLIEEVAIAAHRLALMSLLGGEIGSYMRVPGNDHVLSLLRGAETPGAGERTI